MPNKLIDIVGVSKSYGDNLVLDDLNLYIRENEFLTLLGPSGCGKTTLLRILGGFENPDSGKVIFDGKDITSLAPNKRQLNTVFQKYALFTHMTIAENIAFGLKIKGKSKSYIDDKIHYALKLVNLEGYQNRYPDSLSGGQQQRIAIARAIVNEPKVLLLDEPLGALDLKLRQDMQYELIRLKNELGITFIYVTHDQEEALTMSDTIVVMNQGYIQQIGTPEDIYNEPENAFVADFIGDSNIVTCLFYGAISGSGPATVAAVGSMTIPILIELGYDKDFSAAIVAVAGGLGVIIPPSIPFIMFGSASGESVSDLFIAGIIPGLLIGGLLMVYAVYYCKKNGEDKEKIQKVVGELHEKGLLKVLKESFWALLSPVIILGCIYSGIASPTEAAVISVFYALIVSLFIYKTMTFKDIWPALVEGVRTYAPIMFILAASIAFSRVLTLMQIPQMVSTWILTHFTNKIVLLLVINVFLLIVGMVMDTTPAILILTPILLPIVTAVGMNPIHFGIMMVVNLAIGFVTPPIGVNLFVASSLTDIPIMRISKHAMPMIGYFLVALLLITFIPAISLALI